MKEITKPGVFQLCSPHNSTSVIEQWELEVSGTGTHDVTQSNEYDIVKENRQG